LIERRNPPSVRVAIPWWDDALREASDAGAVVRAPAMRWLAARAVRARTIVMPWRDWLLESAGLGEHVTERLPAGPCVRASVQDEPPGGTWAVAQPVHLVTAIGHLRLAPPHRLAITPDEARDLLATVNGHLAGTGRTFTIGSPDVWSLQCADALDCVAFEPEHALGRNVRDFMPTGRDGAAVRSLMNEIQMLLHEHPVNERRARQGSPAINSLWLWGFGAVAPPEHAALPNLATDDAWLAGIWRLHGQQAAPGDLAGFGAGSTVTARSLVALTQPPAHSPEESLERIDSAVLEGLRDAIAQGRVRALEVFTGSGVQVLDHRSRWRFWRRPAPLAKERA
jgi:hypothetical protein